jgi:hypothetical protein
MTSGPPNLRMRPRVKIYMSVKTHQEEGKCFGKQKRAYRLLNYLRRSGCTGIDGSRNSINVFCVIPQVFHGHASVSKFS